MKYTIQFITAHPTTMSSIVSKAISWGSERAGLWDYEKDSISKINTYLDYVSYYFHAASHIICKKSNGEMVEADWGDSFLIFWRKNGGVRRVTDSVLAKRKAIHILWEIECTKKQQELFDEFLDKCLREKVKYDFLGLLNATKAVGLSIIGRTPKFTMNYRDKVFCSELLFESLAYAGIYFNYKKPPCEISPAQSPELSGASFLKIL